MIAFVSSSLVYARQQMRCCFLKCVGEMKGAHLEMIACDFVHEISLPLRGQCQIVLIAIGKVKDRANAAVCLFDEKSKLAGVVVNFAIFTISPESFQDGFGELILLGRF